MSLEVPRFRVISKRPRKQGRLAATVMIALTLCWVIASLLSPDVPPPVHPETPDGQPFSGTVSRLDAAGLEGALLMRAPGEDSFRPVIDIENAVIAQGAELVTGASTRAELRLQDGSHLVMDQKSSVALVPNEERKLALSEGRMLLDVVSPNDEHATVALKGGAQVEAERAIFALSHRQGVTHVRVVSGEVSVRPAGSASVRAVRAGQEARVGAEGQIEAVEAVSDLSAAVAWSAMESTRGSRSVGRLDAHKPGDKQDFPLALEAMEVDVDIDGVTARTDITHVFRNDTDDELEGVFRFSLPSDAQISRLSLVVGDRVMEGSIVPTARAQEIWNDVTGAAQARALGPDGIEVRVIQRDPAFLRWSAGETFTLNVYPIEAHSTRQVTIGYTQPLAPAPGGWRYTYPLPRDATSPLRIERMKMQASVHLDSLDPTLPVQVEGYSLASSTHDKVLQLEAEHVDFRPTGDLELRLHANAPLKGVLHTQSYRDGAHPDDASYAMFSLRPELPRAELGTTSGTRDVILVLDASYSRASWHAEQRDLVEALLARLDPEDRVGLMACAHTCTALGPVGLSRNALRTRRVLLDALDHHRYEGATDLIESVATATRVLRSHTQAHRSPHIVLLTDGVASLGVQTPGSLKASVETAMTTLPHARLTVASPGGDTDALALDGLAAGGRGAALRLDPGEGPAAHALVLLGELDHRVLRDVEITLPEGLTLAYPTELPSLRAGEELRVLARYDRDIAGDVVIRGSFQDASWEHSTPITLVRSAGSEHPSLARLWAERRIRALELEGEQREAVEGLSQRYGVLSRYTALLALEDEQMMRTFDIERLTRSESGVADATELSHRRKRVRKKLSEERPAKPRRSPEGYRYSSYDWADFELDLYAQLTKPEDAGDSDPELIALRAAWVAEPEMPQHTDALLLALVERGELDEAAAITESWLAKHPDDTSALISAAELEARRGRSTSAERLLLSALDTSPRRVELHQRLARLYELKGVKERACRHHQSLAELDAELDVPKHCKEEVPPQDLAITKTLRRKASRKGMVADLQWEGDARLEIVLLSPDGEVIGRHAPIQGLRYIVEKTQSADGSRMQRATLLLPEIENKGDYRVEAIRVDGVDAPVKARATVRFKRQKSRNTVEIGTATPTAVMEASWKFRWTVDYGWSGCGASMLLSWSSEAS